MSKVEPLALAAVLYPGRAEVREDRLLERCVATGSTAIVSAFTAPVPSTALPANAERAVRRQALDRERPGDPNLLRVLVGLVVEQLELGVPPDRRVDLFAAHAFLDVRVVGDRLQRDVLHSLVDESVPDVVRHLGRRQVACADSSLSLATTLDGVREQVVREAGTHQPLSRKRERDSRGVDRDPPPSPLLGHVSRRARSTRWVENEVTRVGRH